MTYFALLAAAFILGIAWGAKRAAAQGQIARDIGIFAVTAFAMSLIFARAFHIAFEGHLDYYLANPAQAFAFWSGGLSVWGGVLGAGTGVLLLFRHRMATLAVLGDAFAPSFASGLALTRLGCFLSGCCYGTVTDVPWAVTYKPHYLAYLTQRQAGLIPLGASETLPIHPTQLYEAAGALLIAVAVLVFGRKPHPAGSSALATLAAYSVLRFVVEFWRADERGPVGPLSLPQYVSIGMLFLTACGLVGLRRAHSRS